MQTFILWLGVVVLVPLFIFRVLFLFEGKKPSIAYESIGTLLVISYYELLHLRIMMTAEIGVFILILYTFITTKPVPEKHQRVIVGLTVGLILIFTFFTTQEPTRWIACMAALFLIFGNYALNNKRKPAGWVLFSLYYFCTAYVVYAHAPLHDFFIHAQIFLGMLCFMGFIRRR